MSTSHCLYGKRVETGDDSGTALRYHVRALREQYNLQIALCWEEILGPYHTQRCRSFSERVGPEIILLGNLGWVVQSPIKLT